MRRIALLLILLGGTVGAAGQYVTLTHRGNASVALALDRLWGYNLYEHSRWGAGLRFQWGDHSSVAAYAGYGVMDRQWKGGLELLVANRFSHRGGQLYLIAMRDYVPLGSRAIGRTDWSSPEGMASLMSLRMEDRLAVQAGYRWHTRHATVTLDGQLFYGGRLCRYRQPLYPAGGDKVGYRPGAELRTLVQWHWGLALQHSAYARDHDLLMRILLQFDRTFPLPHLDLTVFVQAGASTPYCPGEGFIGPYDDPYAFDLGGTFGAPLLFRHGLLTERPAEYAANRFVLLALRLAARRPLWRVWHPLPQVGSCPRPFVGLNAAAARGGDFLLMHNCPLLVAEPVAGIDGLVRWGVVDWGVAFAYRLSPRGHLCHRDNPRDNLALLATASLMF